MGFWDEPEKVDEYEKLADGYDGRELVEYLATLIPPGTSVLELGMGPGKDLDLLRDSGFVVTGSDASQVFVDRYLARSPDADILTLDAVTLPTDRTFGALYSNKVLQHIDREQMRRSLVRQVEVLEPGGIALHALWYGEEDQQVHGMLFTQYTEALLGEVLPDGLVVVETLRYTEMEDDDSLRVTLRRT